MPVLVKICGITSVEDGLAAAEAGADAIGFVFYEKSPRFVPVETAAAISRELPGHLIRVGVFVDAPVGDVMRAASECALQLLQFHGSETPAYCQQFGLMHMKAFRIHGPETLAQLDDYPSDAWLLDAFSPGALGGTGATFNWDLAVEAGAKGRPIFLAGGLTPENVAEAVRKVRPFGVDVSSGVEASPGKKDHARVREFVSAVREASKES